MKSELLLLLIVALAGAAGCSKRQVTVQNDPKPAVARIKVIRIETEAFVPTLAVTGSLASRSVVEVKAETTGRVLRFDKEEGDAVTAGEVVVWVDESKPRLAVREAESAVQVAKAAVSRAQVNKSHTANELERAENLVTSGGITDKDLKSARASAQDGAAQTLLAEAQLAQAEANLATARKHLDDCQVKAPVGGVIYRKLANRGSYVEPATPVMVLVDNARLELESPVAASDLGQIRHGQLVRFGVSSYPGESFTGRVVEISPAVDVDSRTAKVRIQTPNVSGRLKAGMFAQGEIVTGAAAQAILIPLAAVYRDDTSARTSYVFVVESGKARRRQVQIGREAAQRLEIVQGLNPGDLLAQERSIELADGVAVELN